MPEPESPAPVAPLHAGLGLAALILGGLAIPLAVVVGIVSFSVALPTYAVWWFVPIVAIAMGLGTFASRTPAGIAGATLGMVALVICLLFVVLDRTQGPEIRAQLHATHGSGEPPIKLDQLLKSLPLTPATTRPAVP